MSKEQTTRLLGEENVAQYHHETLRLRRLGWALQIAHDHMLMDPTGRGPNSRAFRAAVAVLDGKPTSYPDDPANNHQSERAEWAPDAFGGIDPSGALDPIGSSGETP